MESYRIYVPIDIDGQGSYFEGKTYFVGLGRAAELATPVNMHAHHLGCSAGMYEDQLEAVTGATS